MKVLVFGQSGQVARALQVAAPLGFDMTFLTRAMADLSDPDACAQAILAAKPDVVINAAAYTNVDGAETDKARAQMINAVAPGAMAKACAKLGCVFVHISTDYVFDGTGGVPFMPDAPPAPINIYGRTKSKGEAAIRLANVRHVILRTSWVFSPYGQNFVKTMLRLAQSRPALSVVADQIGGPTPADAIAHALLTLASAMVDGAKGGTYHLAGTPSVSWAQFARTIFELAGKDVAVLDIATADYPTAAPRPLNSQLDCATLAADFGVTQPHWRPALAKVIQGLSA